MTTRNGRGGGAGAGAPSVSRLPRTSKRPARLAAKGLAATTGAMLLFSGIAAAGTPPLGPGNIEIFPKRDMVALEGYADQAGETATVTVKRNGQVIGTGQGEIDQTGFLEFNHPGGECWTGVTPNIKGGDLVEVKFSETAFTDGAVTSSAKIDSVVGDPGANTVTMKGTYNAADFDADGPFSLERFNVEVVNPEMRRPDPATPPTLIGERAIGWTPIEDPAEPNSGPGYTVTGSAQNGTFDVVFTIESDADYERVLDGEHVVTTWMAEANELALGNSLYEFGETDGPGFGGCPAGPASQPPVPPTQVSATRNAGEITLKWTTPQQPADANNVTQYRVAAIDGVTGQEIAVRQGAGAGENTATIQGLNTGQSYKLILEANNGLWSPVVQLGTIGTDGNITPPADETNPDTDGPDNPTNPTDPNNPNPTDPNNPNPTDPTNPTTPTTPTAVAPTAATLTRVLASNESVTAEWTAAQPGNTAAGSAITGYQVVATGPDPDGTGPTAAPTFKSAVLSPTSTTGTVTGLTNGTDYAISVLALAGELSTPSTAANGVKATVKANDVVTVTRAEYRSDRREYRIQGTAADTTANRVHLRIGDVIGSGTTIQLNVPVAADGTWSISVRNGPVLPTNNRFNVKSDSGAGIVAPMTRSR